MLIHSGETMVRHNDSCFIAEPGDAVLLHRDADYEFMTANSCEKSAVILEGAGVGDLLKNTGLNNKLCISLNDSAKLEKCFDQLAVAIPESHNLEARRRISTAGFEIIQLLALPEPQSSLPQELENVLTQISHCYSSTLTLEMMAATAGTSVTNLVRMFRLYLNITPHRYLINLRMHHAELLLDERSFSIKEIAALVGYGNPLNFSTEFRRCHGCSPREWRNSTADRISRRKK